VGEEHSLTIEIAPDVMELFNISSLMEEKNMKHEYREGKFAAENFDEDFRAPKSSAKPLPKKQSTRKAKKSSKVLVPTFTAPSPISNEKWRLRSSLLLS
jgi:hypothetical protein